MICQPTSSTALKSGPEPKINTRTTIGTAQVSETTCTIPDSVDTGPIMPKLSPISWRILNTGMALFFLMAAIANANDGDWYIWMPLYFLPSLLCFVAALRPASVGNMFWRGMSTALFVIALSLSLYQITAIFAVEEITVSNPLIHEEGREMAGLMILLTWSGLMRFSLLGSNGKQQSHQKTISGLFCIAFALAVVPIMAWSICFVGDMHQRIGHCNGMFKTEDKTS